MLKAFGKLKTRLKWGKSIEKHQNTSKIYDFLSVLVVYPTFLSRICTKKFMQVDLDTLYQNLSSDWRKVQKKGGKTSKYFWDF